MFGPPLLKISMIPPHCLFRIITFIDGAGISERQYIGAGGLGAPIYWRSDVPCPLRVWSATPIGAECIGAPIVLAECKEDGCVRCASPIFIPIAY
jgi:hypothetical protein